MLGPTARLLLFRFGIEARLSQAPICERTYPSSPPPYPDACSANRMRGESSNYMVCKLRPEASPQICQQSWEVIESEGSFVVACVVASESPKRCC